MRISDWSSDVCSSDLLDRGIALHTGVSAEELIHDGERVVGVRAKRDGRDLYVKARRGVIIGVSSYERDPSLAKTIGHQLDPVRSEEGRAGKEWVSTCRSRWSPYH